uniref:NADH-ubiquinone oxidoreductase chain 3 n=1 Tax=Phrynocephalus vlangalii pylzowi TaxID=516953 RepID=A0A343QZN5_9SAUR|nr:NADH dehydrogenase subunit 3 [Phrynocephalus vlangalii pylzowi]ATV96465.1 NADH dehydrogenase subunit 3 [Phrynocephalus vlangalii pylzowi]
MNLATTILLTTIIPLILITFNHLAPKTNPDMEKLSPYECGFSPLENARLPLSIQFFLIAIFFLLFDLEIALLLPIPWALSTSTTTTTWMLLLIFLLTLGLAYEWNQGALDWTK